MPISHLAKAGATRQTDGKPDAYMAPCQSRCDKMTLSRCIANILHCSLRKTGHGMAVGNYIGFSLAVYRIFVTCHKKLSMSHMTLRFIFSTWHVKFCHSRVVDMY